MSKIKRSGARFGALLASVIALVTFAAPAWAFNTNPGGTTDEAVRFADAKGHTYMGWAGTDCNGSAYPCTGSLNIEDLSDGHNQVVTTNYTVAETQVGDLEGLGMVGYQNLVLVAYPDNGKGGSLQVALYNGTPTWQCSYDTGQQILGSPWLTVGQSNRVWLAWTGTDNHLNVAEVGINSGNNCPVSISSPYHLTDSATAGPALVDFNGKMQMAWTGTDSGQHLNLATFDFTGVLKNKVKSTYASAWDVSLVVDDNGAVLDLGYTGVDPNHRPNIAWGSDGYHLTHNNANRNASAGAGTTVYRDPNSGEVYIVWEQYNTANITFYDESGCCLP